MNRSKKQMRPEFARYHPGVVFSYFVAVIALTFMSLQPAARIVGLLCAILIVGWQVGLRSLLRSCCFYVVLIVIVALFNALFNPRGLTTVFYFLSNPVSLEALVYGASFGMMLATVLLWFSAYQRLMSQQGFLALFSRIAPNIALMVAKVMAFVPNLLAQGRSITATRRVLLAEGELNESVVTDLGGSLKRGRIQQGRIRQGRIRQGRENVLFAARLSSQLLEWGMESSLITADSMRARGFGSTKRSSYRSMRLTHRDGIVLVVLAVLIAAAALATYVLSTSFSFYPYLSQMLPWWWHVPTVILSILPLLCEGGERIRWRFLR